MIAQWMLYGVAVGVLLALAGSVLERALRLVRQPARWIWLGGLLLMVALPVWRHWGATLSTVGTPAPVRIVADGLSSVVAAATSGSAFTLPSLESVLRAGWVLASLLVVGYFVFGWLRLRHESVSWPAEEWDGVRVRVSASTGPAVLGLARPEIVMPSWVRALDAERRRYVLAHERAHITAGDPWLLHAAAVCVALMPWNPAVWWAAKRLRDAVELDCDRRLLRHGANRETYGTLLIDVAGRGFAPPGAVAPFIGRPSLLARRIAMLIPSPARARLVRAGVALLIGSALVAVACATESPASAPGTTAQRENAAALVTEAAWLSGPPLVYPESLRNAGVTGQVLLEFVVQPDGRVAPASIRVIHSTNHGFDSAARNMIAGSRYRPATGADGKAVASRERHAVSFAIQGRPVPPGADTTMVFIRPATK